MPLYTCTLHTVHMLKKNYILLKMVWDKKYENKNINLKKFYEKI